MSSKIENMRDARESYESKRALMLRLEREEAEGVRVELDFAERVTFAMGTHIKNSFLNIGYDIRYSGDQGHELIKLIGTELNAFAAEGMARKHDPRDLPVIDD